MKLKFKIPTRWLSLLLVLLPLQNALAVLEIQITKGGEGGIPIAIVPFGAGVAGASQVGSDIAGIVSADLARSGRFDSLPENDMLERPSDIAAVQYNNWRVLNIQNLVIGKAVPLEEGWLSVEFRLLDALNQSQLMGEVFRVATKDVRNVAHHISDLIFEKLTGVRGAFSTKIAYVSANQGSYRLIVADADGFAPRTVLESKEPIMSPAWSPDGRKIAYVSFEKKRSEVYVQDLFTGSRKRISSSQGINGAPAWSPNGRYLAITLSKPGNPEIFIMDVQTEKLTRVTNNFAIDTEAAWAPDGSRILFTSDRGGKPQLYEMNPDGGGVKRVTYEGEYNARGSYSADGKFITMVQGGNNQYRIAIMEIKTGNVTILSDGPLDESPSFAPNGAMILYGSESSNRSILAAASSDGRVSQELSSNEGGIREPSWGPYVK